MGHFVRPAVEMVELDLRYVLLIERNVQMRLHFAARTFGIGQKLNKLFVFTSFESFGNVAHGGNGGPLNLVL